MKKIMTLFIVVCLLLQVGVAFAAPGAQLTAIMNSDTFTVEISGSGFGGMDGIFLAIVPKDIPLNRALQYNEFVFSDQPITDSKGGFGIQANLKEGTLTGTYTVYAIDNRDGAQIKVDFVYTSQNDYDTILSKFNEEVNNGNDMKSTLDTYGAQAMMDISDYTNTPAAQQKIADLLFALRGAAFTDIKDLRQDYKTAVLLAVFPYAEDPAGFLNKCGVVLPIGTLDEFDTLTEAQQDAAAICLQKKSFATLDVLVAAIPEAIFVGKANTATLASELKNLFMIDYVSDLNLDTTYYDLVNNKTTVFSNLLDLLAPRFDGYIDAADKFKTAAKAVYDGQGSGGGGAGGGMGGGFGGGAAAGAPEGNGTYVPSANEAQVTAKQYYQDLGSVAWAVSHINKLTDAGILSGDGNGLFRPNDTVTRAEFVKMIVSAFKLPTSIKQSAFSDVTNQWYAPFVASATESGIANGISATYFGANDKITRQDLTVLCYRAAKLAEVSLEGYVLASPNDMIAVADYAKEAVEKFYAAGIINGDEKGAFNPNNNATRAEAAKILSGLLDLKGGY